MTSNQKPNIKVSRLKRETISNQKEQSQANPPGVSIITCTNRPSFMERILANYLRQNYEPRELIIILNNNIMKIDEWTLKTKKYPGIRVFQIDEQATVGECINFAVKQARFDHVAKFDDDDYYAGQFLSQQMNAFKFTTAKVIGKASWHIFFEASQTLAIYNPNNENSYGSYVTGATMVIKKEVFAIVPFPHLSEGDDIKFLQDCLQNNIKIYSTDKSNFVGIRRPAVETHSWQSDETSIL
ncbi:MAG: glycosyltransferase family A protein, partial [Syntrophomonas sp.]